eukprot:7792676-Lingulodinium_polyedra.AAC.1
MVMKGGARQGRCGIVCNGTEWRRDFRSVRKGAQCCGPLRKGAGQYGVVENDAARNGHGTVQQGIAGRGRARQCAE